MSKPIINDQGDVREMNDEEYAQYLIDQETFAKEKAEAEAKATARTELLARLGITEDEAKLLLA